MTSLSSPDRSPRTSPGGQPVQIFEASTLYGAATLAASLDAGQFGPADAARRILLVSNNAAVPETATPLNRMNGFARLADRFDEVLDWNDAIRPHHPSAWTPAADDSPLWERMFRLAWRLGSAPVELIVESIQVSPAKALAAIFEESAVHVYADGLMSYGPTRDRIPQGLGRRIQRLLHLDLVPGLRPLLLTEHAVPSETVPRDAFTAVLGELGEAAATEPALARVEGARPTAVLLGQYLAALDILTADEEEALHVRMLRGAVAAGHRSVLFKPHPTAPARYSRALDKAAAESGTRLEVLAEPVLAEAVYERCGPELVVGCFSTALLTASTYYGVPIARTGTDVLLERLAPYQNSNRVPVTIVDFLVPDLDDAERLAEGAGPERAAADRLGPLVRAVGYCMQSGLYPQLREEAARWLAAHPEAARRYFKRRRLTALALPGGSLPGPARQLAGRATARRAAHRLRSVRRRLR